MTIGTSEVGLERPISVLLTLGVTDPPPAHPS